MFQGKNSKLYFAKYYIVFSNYLETADNVRELSQCPNLSVLDLSDNKLVDAGDIVLHCYDYDWWCWQVCWTFLQLFQSCMFCVLPITILSEKPRCNIMSPVSEVYTMISLVAGLQEVDDLQMSQVNIFGWETHSCQRSSLY